MSLLGKEKLVRDKIPDLIRREGRNPSVRIASNDDLDYLFRMKLLEEATELLESGADEEIVDLLEVLEALISHRKLHRDQLEHFRKQKARICGVFEMGYVLEIEDDQL